MKTLTEAIFKGLRSPKSFLKWIRAYAAFNEGIDWVSTQSIDSGGFGVRPTSTNSNRLREFFDNRTTGRGIWKWEHYFNVYDKHLRKFVDKEILLLEIGIFSGGSLDMWRHYFGQKCNIIGIDIEPACKVYENDFTKVIIGDQESRKFWSDFKTTSPKVDIVIDDGGHKSNQQRVTFEEIFSHIKPGGVFICEDIHQLYNDFSFHSFAITMNLNGMTKQAGSEGVVTNNIQRQIESIHFYPFMVVIEKSATIVDKLVAPRHGSEWQPFL